MRRSPILLALAGMFAVCAGTGASAGDRFGYGESYYGSYPAGAGVYGFGDAAISGAYVGAPLTRFPRPSELVAPALTYGTYGVPTVPGIRQATIGQPVVYSLEGPTERVQRRGHRSRILTRDSGNWVEPGEQASSDIGGARVISLQVR